ncbi:retron-type reverse transcriptase [Salinibacter ruber]|uniref:reverse transcriptase family protein n=1 Tax=Salinibacter ruber TaxID=146919 RepID=UPI0021672072|nr:retron-type reverse transcriptase [Salinibacter ruber]
MSDPELSEDQIEQIQETWENIKSATDREAYDGVSEILSVASETPSRITTPLIRKIQPSGQRASMYETFELPKRRGGTRTISSPNQPILFLQHAFLRVCTHLFPRHDCAHGFERGRSHISNAAQHVGKEWVYSLDIENFFPTIHWGRVNGMLQTHPVNASSDVARILANLCTNDGCLPQGAPTSPILSNLLCRKLDSRLFRWARDNGYTYTRYADDLTFSTNQDRFSEGDRAFIKEILLDEGFTVNKEKERLMPSHTRQMVTGLIVNEKLNVPSEFLRGLRALLHNVEQHGWYSQARRQKWLFDSKEEWLRYRTQDLSSDEFQDLHKKQSQEKLLVNPNALMPKVRDLFSRADEADGEEASKLRRKAVEKFKSVVHGRIDYVRQVRGQEDGLYKHLYGWYEYLAGFDNEVSSKYRKIRTEVLQSDPSYRQRVGKYKSFVSEVEDLPLDDLKDRIDNLTDKTVEFAWIDGAQPEAEYRAQVRKVAYSALTSPFVTARFFRFFRQRDGYFRGLLHSRDVSDNRSTREMLNEAEAIFRVYRTHLPNRLTSDVEDYLGVCRKKTRQSENWHPFDDEDFLKDEVRPFKRRTRFEDGGDGARLIGSLTRKIQELERKYSSQNGSGLRYDLPSDELLFHTHTPSVIRGVKLIAKSMLTNSIQEPPHLQIELTAQRLSDGPEDLNAVKLSFLDRGGKISGFQNFSQLFGGKLRSALQYLRGLCDWRLSFPADHGQPLRIDVMKKEIDQLPESISGVRHDLYFYKATG